MSYEIFNVVRGLHILAVIAWMAGLLYLPRLFAYHTAAARGSELDVTFQTMEGKLLRIIMNPAMVVAWVLGLTLLWRLYTIEGHAVFAQPWVVAKLAGVVFVTFWHQYLASARKAFARGENKKSNKFWRATNELPFLAAIVMVIAVTVEFGR